MELVLILAHFMLTFGSLFFTHTSGDNAVFVRKVMIVGQSVRGDQWLQVLLAPILVCWVDPVKTMFKVTMLTVYDTLPTFLLLSILLALYG